MAKFVLGFLLFLQTLCLQAQDFLPRWIGTPVPDSTSQVWFRQTYHYAIRPRFAMLEVTTTGYFDLYINGYNVSTDVRMPYREHQNDDHPISLCFNVTRFLQNGDNTIGVWFSPTYPHIQPKQIAISLYGRTSDDQPFSLVADSSWLCRKANVSLDTTLDEVFDAPDESQSQWNMDEFAPACWTGAIEIKPEVYQPVEQRKVAYQTECIKKVLLPAYYVVEGDTTCYEFNTGFEGYVRVTMRDAHVKEQLNINGLGYQCDGKMDEQAYRKFTRRTFRNVWITGNSWFQNSQIQRLEGIETGTHLHLSWSE